MPVISARAIPRAKVRRDISIALINFSLVNTVVDTIRIFEIGGKMLENPIQPTTSQTKTQKSSETLKGIFLPNRFISGSAQHK
jgi:hypothetical protein